MKYEVGDRVLIKDIGWFNKNKSKSHGTIACGDKYFEYDMKEWCGKIMTILEVYETCYTMKEDGAKDLWTDEMIECLVEEETVLNKWNGLKVELELSKSVIGVSNIESLHGERFMSGFVKAIIPPDGYIFKDENGNEILTNKIILEKKKKEYPKTYEECCRVLGVSEFEYNHTGTKVWYRHKLMATLDKLMLCRDAYWKIAGEEMRLEKPWEPDWENSEERRYCIVNIEGDINLPETVLTKWILKVTNKILVFPTEEMRDAFYSNFKEEIEKCKELL